MCKKSFSLIELIFMIVVMGIIASVALPRLMDTRKDAIASSLKQDISTITTSIQSYCLIKGSINKISDVVSLNNSVWKIFDTEVKYIENEKTCVDIKIENKQLKINIDPTTGDICQELSDSGIQNNSYDL